jgi:hypothetical protein
MTKRYQPTTALPLEDLKTGKLLDLLQELVDLHEGAMQSTTRIILEQQIVFVHAEIDSRDDSSWGIKD